MIKSAIPAILAPVRRFATDKGGATAIEYAIIASGISVAIAGAIATLGADVKGLYSSVAAAVK